MRRFGVVVGLLVAVLGVALAAQHSGLWPDEIVFIEEADQIKVLSMMQTGDAQLFGDGFAADLLPEIWNAGLPYTNSYGTSTTILLNPAGDPFFSDGRLNPFAIPEVRQAVSYLIDRDYIVAEILSGLAVPRWTVLDPFFFPYVEALDACRAIELEHPYDEARARAPIDAAMEGAGADLDGGRWTYDGEPVTMVGIIPTEDERRQVGNYVADQLENAGFAVDRRYCSAAEASARWLLSDPYDGEWSFYIRQWTKLAVDRDQADDFDALYTSRGAQTPLNCSYGFLPDRQLEEARYVFDRLARRDYETIAERVDLLGEAERHATHLAWRQWLYSEAATWAWPSNVSVLVDVAAGWPSSYLWGHTVRYVDTDGAPIEGGTIRVASPSMLSGPWNPVAGSTATSDRMIQRAAEDWFLYPDPNTGLFLPHLVEYAECYVLYGTPMVATHDHVYVEAVDGIEVPPEAWCDWDAANQVFVPVCEKFPDGLTSRTRTVCTFADDLFENTWHDGSSFTLADLLMRLIMTFDAGKSESPIFDEAQVPALEQLLQTFKGARILSVDPLVIEVYDDRFCLDAESQVFERIGQLFWPYYGSGMAPWHTIAVGVQAEADGLTCFSEVKADQLGVDRQNWVAGPTLETLMDYAREALSESRIPYEPTLGEYISSDEAFERHVNLDSFLREYDHMWIGNGPMRIYEVDPTAKIIVGNRFEDYRHDACKWLEVRAPRYAVLEISGPDSVNAGDEATFDISLTSEGEAYPAADIAEVKYLVFDPTGELVLSGTGEVIGDGQLQVTVRSADTAKLPAGSSRVEIIALLRPVARPAGGAATFLVSEGGLAPGEHPSEGDLALPAAGITITEIKNGRTMTLGSYAQEDEAHQPMRLFVDTTEAWGDGDGPLDAAQYDKQRVKITIQVTPNDLNTANLRVHWELRDPDDPATHADVDSSNKGGDNTGKPHEANAHWFTEADHKIDGQADRAAVDESTVIGEANTVITRVNRQNVSTVFLNFSDDGGDNFVVRAVLIDTKGTSTTADDVSYGYDDSGVLTVWRKRFVHVYAMDRTKNDVQVISPGQGKANEACIKKGANGILDTRECNGDDARVGDTITTGLDGICQTTAAAGDTQEIPVGQGKPNQTCVKPGLDGTLDISPLGDDAKVAGAINTGPNGICESNASSWYPGAYLANVQEILRSAYARGTTLSGSFDPNHSAYIDVVVENRQLDMTFNFQVNVGGTAEDYEEWIAYLKAFADGEDRPDNTYRLIGIREFGITGDYGDTNHFPNCGLAVSKFVTLGALNSTAVHELGHAILPFDNRPDQDVDIHANHSVAPDSACVGKDTRPDEGLIWCPKHARIIRLNVTRSFSELPPPGKANATDSTKESARDSD